jgi:hypothetical protein
MSLACDARQLIMNDKEAFQRLSTPFGGFYIALLTSRMSATRASIWAGSKSQANMKRALPPMKV